MSNRTYLCTKCGAVRRASMVYYQRKETPEQAKVAARWPKHCGHPMQMLSYEQGVAASRMESLERVGWAEKGLYILQRGGKRKWVPAINARQIGEAKQQCAAFLTR